MIGWDPLEVRINTWPGRRPLHRIRKLARRNIGVIIASIYVLGIVLAIAIGPGERVDPPINYEKAVHIVVYPTQKTTGDSR